MQQDLDTTTAALATTETALAQLDAQLQTLQAAVMYVRQDKRSAEAEKQAAETAAQQMQREKENAEKELWAMQSRYDTAEAERKQLQEQELKIFKHIVDLETIVSTLSTFIRGIALEKEIQSSRINELQEQKKQIETARDEISKKLTTLNSKEVMDPKLEQWSGLTTTQKQEEMWKAAWSLESQDTHLQAISQSKSVSKMIYSSNGFNYMPLIFPFEYERIVTETLGKIATQAAAKNSRVPPNNAFTAVFKKTRPETYMPSSHDWFYVKTGPTIVDQHTTVWVNQDIVDVTIMHYLNSIKKDYQADSDKIELGIHSSKCIPALLFFELMSVNSKLGNMFDCGIPNILEQDANGDPVRFYYSGILNGIFNISYFARKHLQPEPLTFISRYPLPSHQPAAASSPRSPVETHSSLPQLSFNPNDFFLNFNLS